MKTLREIEEELDYVDQQKPAPSSVEYGMLLLACFCFAVLAISLYRVLS